MTAFSWASPGTNGNWNKPSNWSPNGIPGTGTGDTVTLGDGSYNVTLGINGTTTVDSVTVGDGVTLTISKGTELDATGGITLTRGTLAGGGTIGSSTNISGHGTVGIAVDGTATDTASGGMLEFTKAVDATTGGTFDIAAGGSLAFDSNVGVSGGANPTVDFLAYGAPSDGTLDLSGEARGSGANGEITQFNATVSGFGYGDEIIVKGPSSNGGDTVSFSGGTLTVKHNNTVEETVQLNGNYTGQNFSITYDSATNDDIITVCFMAGTLIRTPDGEVPVETLQRGALVTTADGRTVPVTWLGRQTVSTRFGDPLRVLPIRIKAGALADNVPVRDLLLSPDHAILVEGALIQAGALINGTSIVREKAVPEVFTYFHVEADGHALILAENTPAETFVDNVDRLNFDNWAEHQALYPEGKTVDELPYPRAKSHRQVPINIRVKLAERAHAIGTGTGAAAVA